MTRKVICKYCGACNFVPQDADEWQLDIICEEYGNYLELCD